MAEARTLGSGAVSEYIFWGTSVSCQFTSQSQKSWFDYYFQDYLAELEAPAAVRLLFDTPPPGPGPRVSAVHMSLDGAPWQPCGTMRDDEVAGSPLPPFSVPPLSTQFVTLHGSCVCDSEGSAVVFSGPSGIGKTNMALALLREGYSFLSDDIIVLHRADRVSIEPYTRPLGIREDTLDRFPNILAGLGNVPRFATPTGRTAVPHVNLLPLKKREEPATWTWTVTLERAEARGVRELGPRTLAVTMRTVDADLEWAAKLATDWMQHDRPAK